MVDLVIIGGSAAATAAGIYASRRKLNFLIVSEDFGGEVATSGEILNYPGFAATNGIELAEKFREQLTANGVTPELSVRIESIRRCDDGTFELKGKKISTPISYEAQAVIVTTGVHPRLLGVPGEKEYRGKGVSYCTTCDGPLFKQKTVVTIGGGNSALESALMLAEIASHVTLITINPELKGEQVLIDKVVANPKVSVVYSATTARIEGEQVVKSAVYVDAQGAEQRVDTQGVFIHIGMIPNSDLVPAEVKRNAFKEIEVSMKCETSVPGLFAAGDVTAIPYKQIAIAAGQGVTAALSAIEYLNKRETP